MSVNINTVDTASQAAGQWSGASFDTEISDAELTVTRAAGEQLAALFAQVEDDEYEAIRIYVAGGGCSGMTYGMTYTGERNPYDKVLKGDGYSIYVDAVAHAFLNGVEIDYETRETGATFVFNNVFQATGGSGVCGGCGAAGGCG